MRTGGNSRQVSPNNRDSARARQRFRAGVYVPTPRKGVKSANLGELKAAADRLAAALASMSEEEVGADYKEWRRRKIAAAH